MEHSVERNTILTYIYRLYPDKGTLRYFFAMPISYRGGGRWEAHAWNSLYKLWPKELGAMPDFSDVLKVIYEQIKMQQKHSKIYIIISKLIEKVFKIYPMPYFSDLVGTFEVNRLPLYKRLFRKNFNIEVLGDVYKIYNGMELNAKYVSFIPRWEKE